MMKKKKKGQIQWNICYKIFALLNGIANTPKELKRHTKLFSFVLNSMLICPWKQWSNAVFFFPSCEKRTNRKHFFFLFFSVIINPQWSPLFMTFLPLNIWQMAILFLFSPSAISLFFLLDFLLTQTPSFRPPIFNFLLIFSSEE